MQPTLARMVLVPIPWWFTALAGTAAALLILLVVLVATRGKGR
jgi:hypothetical protein